MPIFEFNGQEYDVEDKYINSFAKEFPDAISHEEAAGKKYRVKAKDYDVFRTHYYNNGESNPSDSVNPYKSSERLGLREQVEEQKRKFPKLEDAPFMKTEGGNPQQYNLDLQQRITDSFNKGELEPILNAKEDENINQQYTPKKEEEIFDVYENAVNKFSLTKRGSQLQGELAQIQDEITNKYLNEFKNSDVYKSYANKQYKTQAEVDEANRMINDLFSQYYSETIHNELKPYQEVYNKEISDRYGIDINKGVNAIQKKETANKIDELNKQLELLQNENAQFSNVRTYVSSSSMPASARIKAHQQANEEQSAKSSNLYAAQMLLDDANNTLSESSKKGKTNFFGGMFRGVGDTAGDVDNWTMGVSNLLKEISVGNAFDKLANGKELTKDEQLLLDAYINNIATHYHYDKDLGRGYKAGKVTGESLPFMLDFILNPLSGAGKAVAKKMLTSAIKRGIGAASSNAAKFGGRLIGDAVAASGMTLISGMPSVMSETERRLNEDYDYSFDGNGNLSVVKKGEVGLGEAFAKSFVTRTIENQSEMIFNAFGKWSPFNKLANEVGNVLPEGVNGFFMRLKNSKPAEWYREIKNNPTLKEVAEKAQFHGLPEEYFEEVYNNFANVALGEMSMDEALDLDNNIDTFLGLAPTSVVFGAIGLGGMAKERYINRRNINRVKATMSEEQKAKLEELQRMGKLSENKDIREFIKITMADKSLTPEEKRAEIEYAYEVAKNNAINEVTEAETEDKVSADNATIDAATDLETGLYGQVQLKRFNDKGEEVRVPANVFGVKIVNGEEYLRVQEEGSDQKNWVRPTEYYADTLIQMPADKVKALNEQVVRQNAEAQAEAESRWHPNIPEPTVGASFNNNGELVTIVGVDAEGNPFVVPTEEYEKAKGNEHKTNALIMQAQQLGAIPLDTYKDSMTAQIEAEEAAQQQAKTAENSDNAVMPESVQEGSVEGVSTQNEAESGSVVENAKPLTLEQVVATLPKDKNGKIDYKSLTPQQQYQYTSLSESPEVALEDLQADIEAKEGEIAKKKEKLATAKGGERAMLRDEIKELNASYEEMKSFYESVTPKQEEIVQPESVSETQVEAIEEKAEEIKPTEEVVTEEVQETTEPISGRVTESAEESEAAHASQQEITAEEQRRIPLRERINEWAKALGLQVHLIESIEDAPTAKIRAEIEAAHKARKVAPGWITNGEVYFFLPDLVDLSEVDKTFIHEVVAHKGLKEMLGEERFNELCDKVWEMIPQDKKDFYTKEYPIVKDMKGVEQQRAAADEYIAELSENENLSPEEQTIWDRIVQLFREAFDKALGGILSKSQLTNADISTLIKMSYANLKSGKAENVEGENNRMRAVERLEENVGEVDAEKGDVRFAVKDVLKGKEREQAIKDLMEVTGRSEKTVKQWLKAEESLASVILNEDNVGLLDLEADESVPSIWNNSDYPQGTVEFSNICKKRLPFTNIYQRLQKEFPNTLFDAETLNTIRNTMKEMGEDVACALCFVEDRRQLLGEIGQGFIDAVEGKDVELNENQVKALDKLKESGDKYVPNLFDIITLDGMKELRKTHPAVAQAFIEYNNARGMQSGRLFQAYSAYNREILKYNKKKVESINNNGGLRIFSFSDFEAHHLIELVQVLTDCAAKGIKVQGYTKVPEFAKAVKDTGAKINRSLIAKGEGYVDENYVPKEGEAVSPNVINGKRLLFDTVEGINVNDPNFFDSTNSKSVGNILVAINDEQARLAMADPFVDYIIGFHTSQAKKILKGKGIDTWTNYKNEQLDKVIETDENGNQKMKNAPKHGLNIYTDVLNPAEAEGNPIKTAKQFTERFLEECNKRDYIPRFHRFLNRAKDGRFLYTPGYHKFLIDFKLFDKNGKILPQEAVKPIFDNEFNKQILDDYVKDMKEELPNDEVYEAVKDAIGLGSRFSIAEKEIDNVVIKDTEEQKLPTNREEAFEYIPAKGISFPNLDQKINVKVSRNSVKHTSLHNNKDTFAIFAAIGKVISNAVKIGSIPVAQDEIGHTHSVNIFYVPINVNGRQYSARLVVKELENKGIVLDELSLYNVSMHKEKGSVVQPLNASEEVGGITTEPKSVYKIKELIHNSQELDKEIVGIFGETRFRFTSEEKAIIDKAKADGTYMKAPNGNPTNLNEKQWAQVRTDAFKKWFGDWENDAVNASKIVDENGEPLVVYHGSEEDFTVFDKTRGRANMDVQGMFFSPWDDDARGYGSNVRAFYLNIKNPANENKGYKALKMFQGQNGAGVKAREYLVSQGYDGLNNEDQEYVAFEPTQIKSATDNVGTFDAENPDIRFRTNGRKLNKLQSGIDEFTNKYNSSPVHILSERTKDEDASKWIGLDGVEAQDLINWMDDKKASATHSKLSNEIIIFADRMKPKKLEKALFHENLHNALNNDLHKDLVANFYQSAINDEKFDKWKKLSNKYPESEREEEFFVYVVSNKMVNGEFEDVFAHLSEEGKNELLDILKQKGYNYESERSTRTSETSGRSGRYSMRNSDVQRVADAEEERSGRKEKESRRSKDEAARLKGLFDKVADMGLRGVIGNTNYDIAMLDIFYALPESERTDVAINAVKNYGADVAVAVDEYLSKVDEPTLLDKVVSVLRDALRKVGIEVELTPNDVKYLLWRSRKPLNRNSILDVAEDVDMRYKLKVGEYEDNNPDDTPDGDGGGTRFSVKESKPKTKKELQNEIRDLKEERRDLKDELRDLKKQVNTLRAGNKEEWETKQRAIVSFVNGRLTKEAGESLGNTRIAQIIRLVNSASTATELRKPLQFIEQVINSAIIDNAAAKMDKLIKTKLQGETNRGVAKGIVVDESTRRLFDSIRTTFKDLVVTSIDGELSSVRSEIMRFGKEINDLPEDDKQGRSILKQQQEKLKEKKKELEKEKEELLKNNILETKETLKQRREELEAAMDDYIEGKGVWTIEMQDEYDSIPLREKLAEIRESQAQLEQILVDSIQKRRDAYSLKGADRKMLLAEVNMIEDNYVIAQEELIKLMNEVTNELSEIIKEGKSRLAMRKEALAARRIEIVRMGIEAVKDKGIKPLNSDLTAKEKFEKWYDNSWLKGFTDFLTAPLNSFNFMLKFIDRNHRIGEGELYNRFMKSEEGALAANNRLHEGLTAYNNAIEEKIKEIFGKSAEKVIKDSGKKYNDKVRKQAMYDGKHHKAGDLYPISISKGEALYVWLTWRQDDGRSKLIADGWTEQSISDIEDLIGENYIKFGEWVTDDFFPMLRNEKYNKTHIELFGTSMAKREHYFPFKVVGEDVQAKGEMGETYSGMPSTVTGNIIKRTINKSRINTEQNAFDLLYKYGSDMESWNAMAKLRQDLNFLYSSKAFRNYLEANSKGLYDKFIKSAEVAVRAYNNRDESNSVNDLFAKLNKMWAGTNIGFRLNTALKQILSYPAFMAYSGNLKYQAYLGKYMLNWLGNYNWAKDNLPAFNQRVESGDIGLTGLSEETFDNIIAKGIEKFGEWGMIPNQLVDALTCAAGARAVYDFEFNKAIKNGLSEEEAKNIAQYNAEIAFNETQQSSREEFVSPIQKSRNVVIKSLMNYQNSNVGYQRMGNEGFLEIMRAKRVYQKDIESGMDKAEAKKKLADSILRGSRKMMVAFTILPGLWYLGGRGVVGITSPLISSLFGGGGDDEPYLDDEAKSQLMLSMALSLVAGTSFGQFAASWAQGREYDAMGFLKEAQTVITDAIDEGMNLNTIKNIALKLSKFGGVNVETFENIYIGVEHAIRTGNPDLVDFMFVINLPASQRKAFADEYYSDMPFMEYAEKVARAQKLFNDYKKNFPYTKSDKKGSKQNAIKKQYVIENLSKEEQESLENEKKFKKLKSDYKSSEDKQEWLEENPEYKELEDKYKKQEVTKKVKKEIKKLK